MAAFAGLLGSAAIANTLGDDKDKKAKKECCKKGEGTKSCAGEKKEGCAKDEKSCCKKKTGATAETKTAETK